MLESMFGLNNLFSIKFLFFIFINLLFCNARRNWNNLKNGYALARHSKTQYYDNPFLTSECNSISNNGNGGSLLKINNQCNYPLEECYTNDSGYMCCNRGMEILMQQAYNELKQSQGCDFCEDNTQILSNRIQKKMENRYNKTKFEVVTGVSDYASKIQFQNNFVCKIKIGNRVMLAFAAPQPQPPQEYEIRIPPKFERVRIPPRQQETFSQNQQNSVAPPQFPTAPQQPAQFLPPLIPHPQIYEPYVQSPPQNPPPPQFYGPQEPEVVYPHKRIFTWRL